LLFAQGQNLHTPFFPQLQQVMVSCHAYNFQAYKFHPYKLRTNITKISQMQQE